MSRRSASSSAALVRSIDCAEMIESVSRSKLFPTQAANCSICWVPAGNRRRFAIMKSITFSATSARATASGVPVPASGRGVEHDCPLLLQALQEFADEERVAPGLLVDPFAEGAGALPPAVQGVGDQFIDRIAIQRLQADLHRLTQLPDLVQGQLQRMARVCSVAAVGADDQHLTEVARGDQPLDQVEGRDVAPLQIVHEDDQGVTQVGEDLHEIEEHDLQAVLRLGGWQFGHGWLVTDDQPQLRNQVQHQPRIGAQGRPETPGATCPHVPRTHRATVG
jgi:hypothetical protein